MGFSTVTLGIVLIVIGVLIFVYQGFTYKKNEKIAQVGDVKVTAGIRKYVSLPPLVAGLAFAAGVILVILGKL